MIRLVSVSGNEEYYEFVRLLRTDERVCRGFIEQVKITPEQQKEYMKRYENCYWICLYNECPAGFIGVIDNDIRICTHPDFQGKGVARQLLAAAETSLHTMGCSRATLDTTKLLGRAILFYTHNGYRATGNVKDFFGMPLFEYMKIFADEIG